MRTSTALPLGQFPPRESRLALDGERRKTHEPIHRIEVFVSRIQQLFNSMDPSPFHEKDLDSEAEEFIVSRLQEFSPHDHVSVIIHVSENARHEDLQAVVEMAVHNHFLYRAQLKRLELQRLLRVGRTSLLIGLLFLAVCLAASELLLLLQRPGPVLNLLRESLTIAGWVAMWRPMQLFLYDWWPLRDVGRLYRKLSRVRVEVRAGDAAGVKHER